MNAPYSDGRITLRYSIGRIWLPLRRLVRATLGAKPEFNVLLFHEVASEDVPTFERLLVHVRNAHGILAPEDIAASYAGAPLPQPRNGRAPCLITFDDGFASNFAVAETVLKRLDVRALFFVCPAFVGIDDQATSAAIRDHMLIEPSGISFMDWEQLRKLHGMGHTIGAHTLHHRRLSTLHGAELEREIVESGDWLERELGAPVEWFAFPFGDVGSIHADALNTIAGRFRYCCTGIRGINDVSAGRLGLYRQPLEPRLPFDYQRLIVEGGFDVMYGRARRRYETLLRSIGRFER